MKVEISNGELLDRISILELKILKIEDKEKLVNIHKEFNILILYKTLRMSRVLKVTHPKLKVKRKFLGFEIT